MHRGGGRHACALPLPQLGRSDKGVHLQGGQDNFYVAWVFALELKLSKSLSGLVYFVLQLCGGAFAPHISTVQNTQAHSEFLTTSIPKQKPRLHKNYLAPLVNYPPCLTFRIEGGLGQPLTIPTADTAGRVCMVGQSLPGNFQ